MTAFADSKAAKPAAAAAAATSAAAPYKGPSVRAVNTTHPQWGPNVIVLDSRAAETLLSKIRDRDTQPREFAYYSDRLLRYYHSVSSLISVYVMMCCGHSILAEECLALLPTVRETRIETFCGPYTGLSLPRGDNIGITYTHRCAPSCSLIIYMMV